MRKILLTLLFLSLCQTSFAVTRYKILNTSHIDTFSELDAIVADKALVNKADGAVWLGTHDFGGAVIEIPNGTDPNVDAAGEISQDTDGANETGDVTIRGFDGTNQFAVGQKIVTIFTKTIVKPQDFADAVRDLNPLWHNNTGMVFNITEIWAWSGTDDTTVTIEVVSATNFGTPATVDALEIAANGTSVFTDTETTITDATIAHDEIITADFDDTDDPGYVMISIKGWFNADID